MSISPQSTDTPLIVASGLVKIFKVADLEVVALQSLDLEIARSEFLALVGPSGSGKSTLLSALGGLDRPSAGRLRVDGRDLLSMSASELSTYRREQVGFVWQQTTRNLLPYLTARENIELLMTLSGTAGKARRAWVDELLEAVGMSDYAKQRIVQLSGGQQQRIAIACALANRPQILLGDELTGEVDWPTAERILALLRELRERYGITIVVVTHDPRVAAQADRTIAIRDGRTSTERVRLDDSEIADTDPIHTEEMVVIDGVGRLQLPADQRLAAGLRRRARVEYVDGGLLIRPIEEEAIEEIVAAPSTITEASDLYDEPERPQRGWPWKREKREKKVRQ